MGEGRKNNSAYTISGLAIATLAAGGFTAYEGFQVWNKLATHEFLLGEFDQIIANINHSSANGSSEGLSLAGSQLSYLASEMPNEKLESLVESLGSGVSDSVYRENQSPQVLDAYATIAAHAREDIDEVSRRDLEQPLVGALLGLTLTAAMGYLACKKAAKACKANAYRKFRGGNEDLR